MHGVVYIKCCTNGPSDRIPVKLVYSEVIRKKRGQGKEEVSVPSLVSSHNVPQWVTLA